MSDARLPGCVDGIRVRRGNTARASPVIFTHPEISMVWSFLQCVKSVLKARDEMCLMELEENDSRRGHRRAKRGGVSRKRQNED